eukprot:GDKJ01018709.1.p1 GENE.GDKJ01018709.1~~GDKJ01018709.1.p1  ORF type:complete len:549 (+),score=96.19 GDKJ01018709.1:39-1685(+)
MDKKHLETLAVVYDNICQLYTEDSYSTMIDEFDFHASEKLDEHDKRCNSENQSFSHISSIEAMDQMFVLCEDKLCGIMMHCDCPPQVIQAVSMLFQAKREVLSEQIDKMKFVSRESARKTAVKPSISNATTDVSLSHRQNFHVPSEYSENLRRNSSNSTNTPRQVHSIELTYDRPFDAPKPGIGKPYLASEVLSEKRKEKERAKEEARQAQLAHEAAVRRKEHIPYSSGMTRKQLLEFINEVYDAKQKADERCRTSGTSREPFAVFLEGYLATKYGVKRMIQAVSTAIVNACQVYGPTDAWIHTFDRILRGDVDEEFRNVLIQLKETVDALLKSHFRTQKPFKSDAGLDFMVEEVKKDKMSCESGVGLSMSVWSEIVGFMYNQLDAQAIIDHMQALAQSRQQNLGNRSKLGNISEGSGSNSNRDNLTYSEAVEIMMEFQLDAHTNFLVPFKVLFEKFSNGSANISFLTRDSSFPSLLRYLGLLYDIQSDEGNTNSHSGSRKQNLQNSIQVVNSFLVGHIPPLADKITFSDAVAVLSAEIVLMHQAAAV